MLISEGFIIIYIIVAVNFMMGKMKDFSCSVQSLVTDNLVAKHLFNMVAVFFLIVIFTRSAPVPPLTIVGVTVLMYAYFILLTKCDVTFLIGFIVCMCVIFYIEADKNYKLTKTQDKDEKEQITNTSQQQQIYINVVAIVFVLIGVLVYIGQHSLEYQKNWSWTTFFLGVSKCQNNGSISHGFWKDISEGVARIFTKS